MKRLLLPLLIVLMISNCVQTKITKKSYQPPSSLGVTKNNPIHIIFDMHTHADYIVEAFGGASDLKINRTKFQNQLKDFNWLLNLTDKYQAKTSFLSVGPWSELCLDDIHHTNQCLSLIKRVYDQGKMIGFHSHEYLYEGSLNQWSYISPDELNDEETIELLKINRDFVDQMITKALNINDKTQINKIMLAFGSALPVNVEDRIALMQSWSIPMSEGSQVNGFIQNFGHNPFNPFRYSDSSYKENLNSGILTIPQYPIFNQGSCNIDNQGIETCPIIHSGIKLDVSINKLKALFLSIYLNWKLANNSKVWHFGMGSHLHDWSQSRTKNRERLKEMLEWISLNFISTGEAKFSNYPEVLGEYNNWEAKNPGVSSFDFSRGDSSFQNYQYNKTINIFFRHASLHSEFELDSNIKAYKLFANQSPYLLLIPRKTNTHGASTIDVSKYFIEKEISSYDLEIGSSETVDSTHINLSAKPLILCSKLDCQKIIDSAK